MQITIVYLAAGNSRRFGENKLLYPLDGTAMYRCLLERLVRIAKKHAEWELLVVTQHTQILEELAPRVRENILQTVYSPDSKKGISYTIRAGIEAAERQRADACAFFVADQPYLKEETAEKFLERMERDNAAIGCVFCGGESGNPAWFSKRYFSELKELSGDRGGKKVLKQHWESVHLFSVEEEQELKDLDCREDFGSGSSSSSS